MHALVMTARIDDRYETGQVTSRIGLSSTADLFSKETHLLDHILTQHAKRSIDCVLIDESQFLTQKQVKDLTRIVDFYKIPVLCYGLRTDFKGELFEGSMHLLAWADKLIELKTVCFCGRKATMVVRFDAQGQPITEGEQIRIGGNDVYESMCRAHFQERVWQNNTQAPKT